MNPFTLRQQTILPVTMSEAWELVSQTSKVNHAIGLPPINYTEQTINGKIHVVGTAKQYGLTPRWIEHPFEWIEGQQFQVEREFLNIAPLRGFTGGTRLEHHTSVSTLVETFVTVYPANIGGYAMGRAIAQRMVSGQAAFYADLAQKLRTQRHDYFPPPTRVQYNRQALQEGISRLRVRNLDPTIITKLEILLQTGRDEDVAQIQPFMLADTWQTDRMETLRVFLYATADGLLDLNWEVLCPNCRVSKASSHTLRDLQATAHCEVCNIRYDANFDDYVELRFSVNPTIRYASNTMFCALGSPALNQHIVAQQRLKPNEARSLSVSLVAGGYRIRMLGSEQRCSVQVNDDVESGSLNVSMTTGGIAEQTLQARSGMIAVHVTNQSATEQLLIIERDAWGSGRVSASLVTSMNEFRTLFSSEVLAPGLGLAIKNLTILFSDIKDSTPMYEQYGDSTAYAVVRDHFDTLFKAISNNDGAVVKTIGDAVMAVFGRSSDAVTAALDIHQNIAEFNRNRPDRPPIIIKIGLHTGACIAVNANDLLDYFGTTVNAAARAQGLSVGNDVVITADVMHAPNVTAILTKRNIHSDEFQHQLKGLASEYTLFRLTSI